MYYLPSTQTLEDLLFQRLITSATLLERLIQSLASNNSDSGIYPLSNTSPSHSLGLEGAKVAAETESSVPSLLGQPVANIDIVSFTNEPTESFGNFNPFMTDPLSEESWSPPK